MSNRLILNSHCFTEMTRKAIESKHQIKFLCCPAMKMAEKLHLKKVKVDDKFHDSMKSLTENLKLNGKVLMAAAWTTLEESR